MPSSDESHDRLVPAAFGIARTWTRLQEDYSDISSVSLSSSSSSPLGGDDDGFLARDVPPANPTEQHVAANDDVDDASSSSIVDLTTVQDAPSDEYYEDDFEPGTLTDQLVEAMAATAQLHVDNSARMAELRERELRRQSLSFSAKGPAVVNGELVTEKLVTEQPLLQQPLTERTPTNALLDRTTQPRKHAPARQQAPVLQQRRPLNLAAALPAMVASVSNYTSHHILHQPCVAAPPRGRLAPHLLQQLATAMEQMQQEAASLHLRG